MFADIYFMVFGAVRQPPIDDTAGIHIEYVSTSTPTERENCPSVCLISNRHYKELNE